MISEQDQNDTVSKILDAAEFRIRNHGFNAFSFRDIAADVGIKSASVHYHFPTKADLGEAVLERYSASMKALLTNQTTSAEERLQTYIARYKESTKCLAGVMAAELASLPEALNQAVKQYFAEQLDTLKELFQQRYPKDKKKKSKARAQQFLAGLQGGLLLAHTLNDKKIVERTLKELV